MDDEQILAKGGTEEDIAEYAHDEGGACGAIYGGTCDYCGETDLTYHPMNPLETIINDRQKDIKETFLTIAHHEYLPREWYCPTEALDYLDTLTADTARAVAVKILEEVERLLPNEDNTVFGFPVIVSEKADVSDAEKRMFLAGHNNCRQAILSHLNTLKEGIEEIKK